MLPGFRLPATASSTSSGEEAAPPKAAPAADDAGDDKSGVGGTGAAAAAKVDSESDCDADPSPAAAAAVAPAAAAAAPAASRTPTPSRSPSPAAAQPAEAALPDAPPTPTPPTPPPPPAPVQPPAAAPPTLAAPLDGDRVEDCNFLAMLRLAPRSTVDTSVTATSTTTTSTGIVRFSSFSPPQTFFSLLLFKKKESISFIYGTIISVCISENVTNQSKDIKVVPTENNGNDYCHWLLFHDNRIIKQKQDTEVYKMTRLKKSYRPRCRCHES